MLLLELRPTLAHQIQTALLSRVGRYVRDLEVFVADGGVILRGLAFTYYAKQLAQHEAVRITGLSVVANEIEVQRR
jgi:hypothetical protein